MAATAVKEHGMLFAERLVKAFLDDLKTQTRRPIKPTKRKDGCQLVPELLQKMGVGHSCPYGSVGDRIYVRETWAADDDLLSYWGDVNDFPENRKNWRSIKYRAGADNFTLQTTKWTPNIHMPKWAARLWFEITNVRVERVQAISWSDAVAEGIKDPRRAATRTDRVNGPVGQFARNWNEHYVLTDYSWEKNPWVLVLDLKPVTPPPQQ